MATEPRTVLVTGATDGIGLQTALDLARLGHRVILHGRSPERLDSARRQVAEVGTSAGVVLADLASLVEVRRMAAEVRAATPTLDSLVNNAGVYLHERRVTPDGHEATWAINHLAPFLLTHLLLDLLRAAPDGRVVNVSSIAHARGRIDLADPDAAQGYDRYRAYAQSKLANVLFGVELARRLGPTTLRVNALHPGVVSTKLLTQGMGATGADSLTQGAATSVYLATSPEVTVSGRYFVNRREVPAAPQATDPAMARALYNLSCWEVGIAGLPG